MSLAIVPMTCKAAAKYVGEHHRHNRPPNGGLFAAAVEEDGKVVGVAICGRPIARLLDDGRTVEITRCCTDGAKNACSMLYAALCRAAAAVGYETAVTYTLKEEPGTSLLAAGFVAVAAVPVCTWNRKRRPRYETDLFGQEQRPRGEKVRWERVLNQRGKRERANQGRSEGAGSDPGIVAGVRLRGPGVPDRQPEGTVHAAGRDDAPGG